MSFMINELATEYAMLPHCDHSELYTTKYLRLDRNKI